MKIGIDISQIVYGTGASVYTKKLVENLLKVNKQYKIVLFAGSLRRKKELSNFYEQIKTYENCELKIYPLPPTVADILWNRLHLVKVESFTGHLDLFHSSDWTQPPTSAIKVTTVHDLAPILLPEETPLLIRQVHKRRLDLVKNEVTQIIVPSESTKKDLLNIGFTKIPISVIPEAPYLEDYSYLEAKVKENILKKYGLKGKYMLSIGLNPRKNVSRIVESFQAIRVKEGINNLVIVGNGEMPKNLNRDKVITTGHISDKELYVLLSGASVFVYPSLYEGFGIPILESFKLGVPVVTSNISSMPEVAGQAAVLVDPKSVEGISNGIIEALRKHKSLVEKGFDRVKRFSWETNAIETLNIYHKLLRNN